MPKVLDHMARISQRGAKALARLKPDRCGNVVMMFSIESFGGGGMVAALLDKTVTC